MPSSGNEMNIIDASQNNGDLLAPPHIPSSDARTAVKAESTSSLPAYDGKDDGYDGLMLSIHPDDARYVTSAAKAFTQALKDVKCSSSSGKHSKKMVSAKRPIMVLMEDSLEAVQKCVGTSTDEGAGAEDVMEGRKILREFVSFFTGEEHSDENVSNEEKVSNATRVETGGVGLALAMLLYCGEMDKSSKLLAAFQLLIQDAAGKIKQGSNDLKANEGSGSEKMSSNISSTSSDAMQSDENQSGRANGANQHPKSSMSFTGDALLSVEAGSKKTSNEKDTDVAEEAVNTSWELSKEQMKTMFESVLLSISFCCAISQRTESIPIKSKEYQRTRAEVSSVSKFAAERLFRENELKAKSSTINTISFEVFGDWYNRGGYELVPWIELLDLRKWNSKSNKEKDESLNKNKPLKRKKVSSAEGDDDADLSPMEQEDASMADLDSNTAVAMDEKMAIASPPCSAPQRCVVSFDFSGTMPDNSKLHVNITEENLYILQAFVNRTKLIERNMDDIVVKIVNSREVSTDDKRTLTKRGFVRCILRDVCGLRVHGDLLSSSSNNTSSSSSSGDKLSVGEEKLFQHMLESLYSCFDLDHTEAVPCIDLSVGFTFLCSGSKSAKLARAFDLIDVTKRGELAYDDLTRYLRCYLSVLVGLSLTTYNFQTNQYSHSMDSEGDNKNSNGRTINKKGMYCAIHNGSEWTASHICSSPARANRVISFESFADWYTEGGFQIAPWLELLDLKKFLNLLEAQDESKPLSNSNLNNSSLNHQNQSVFNQMNSSHAIHPILNNSTMTSASSSSSPTSTVNSFVKRNRVPPDAVAFTFPLAKGNQLVVLKDDLVYVRKVVAQLGFVDAQVQANVVWEHLQSMSQNKERISQKEFVNVILEVIKVQTLVKAEYDQQVLLQNFFSSFDLSQCGNVPSNQLMGGMTLLCDGRKSQKLAFCFHLFASASSSNSSRDKEMNNDDLFYFLRSFLIVLFSCCAQSLELTADQVSTWITDTARMCCRDVMHHQWQSKKETVDFKSFGTWYNGGGFETAPWLELLDLKKWALDEDLAPSSGANNNDHNLSQWNLNCQQPSASTPSFCNAKLNGHDDQNDHNNLPGNDSPQQPIKFHMLTHGESNGVYITFSPDRVARLRQLVQESNLANMNAKVVIDHFVNNCANRSVMSKSEFDQCMRSLIRGETLSLDAKNGLSELLNSLFYSFDRTSHNTIMMGQRPMHEVALCELASGFSVLCGGKKSDKLECTFDLFDNDQDGKLLRADLHRFLRSFITLFVCLSSTASSDPSVFHQIDAGASWAVEKIFRSRSSNESYISFDDFASWYTDGGYSSIPWLELLDLRKWMLQS